MQKINKIAIGKKLRELRIKNNYTGQYLCDNLGFCGRTKISQFERGNCLSFNTISKFAIFYKIQLSELLELGDSIESQDNKFSILLKEKMAEIEMSKKGLRAKTGMCIETINSWLNGLAFPNEDNLWKLRDVLNIKLSLLWKSIEDAKKERFNQ